jgi:hypothetical protein
MGRIMALIESVVVRGKSGITDPLKSLLQSEWEKKTENEQELVQRAE